VGFPSVTDLRYYLNTLAKYDEVYDVRVYAFCLMTNHVHLLLAPSDHTWLTQLMKRLAGRQTRLGNKREGRSGTLWETRSKSSLVDAERYLLACVRYSELNPVRAGMVADSGVYVWSSFRARIGHEFSMARSHPEDGYDIDRRNNFSYRIHRIHQIGDSGR
jgi:putative transposase